MTEITITIQEHVVPLQVVAKKLSDPSHDYHFHAMRNKNHLCQFISIEEQVNPASCILFLERCIAVRLTLLNQNHAQP